MKHCDHDPVPGPRIPLRYGSAPSEVCSKCGAYRLTLHVVGEWREGPPDLTPVEDD